MHAPPPFIISRSVYREGGRERGAQLPVICVCARRAARHAHCGIMYNMGSSERCVQGARGGSFVIYVYIYM